MRIPNKFMLLSYMSDNLKAKTLVNISEIESFDINGNTITIMSYDNEVLTTYYRSDREAMRIGKKLERYKNQVSAFITKVNIMNCSNVNATNDYEDED